MARYFIPSQNAGEQAGQQLTGYVSQGLQALADQRLREMAERKEAAQRGREEAAFRSAKLPGELAHADPRALQHLIGYLSENESKDLNNVLYGSPQQQPSLQQQITPSAAEQQPGIPALIGGLLQPKNLKQPQVNEFLENKRNAPVTTEAPLPQKTIEPTSAIDRLRQSGLPLTKKNIDAAMNVDKQRAEQEGRKFKETVEIHKIIEPEIKDAREKARSAKRNNRDLDRLEELNTQGLPSVAYLQFLENSGLDIPALQGANAEEFGKIAQSFLRDAKQYLGSRISNFELEQFLRTIPSLSQSPEGRHRVISNLKYLNDANIAYNDAYQEVASKYKGADLLDIGSKVDKIVDKKLDNIEKKFRNNLKKQLPKGSSITSVAAAKAAGSALGNIPQALGYGALGAGLGALRGGSVLGIPGALAGGLGGGIAGLTGVSPLKFITDLLTTRSSS